MTAQSRALVQASWAVVTAEALPFAERFVVHVVAIAPDARQLLSGIDGAVRDRTVGDRTVGDRTPLTDLVASLVRALDEPDRFVADAAALGARYAGGGVQDAHYAMAGDALRAALADVLGARFTPATRAAWTEAYGLVTALMHRGAALAAAAAGPL